MIQHVRSNSFSLTPAGGLGNRLLVIASGLRLLDKGYFDSMRLNWLETDELNAPLENLFSITATVEYGPPYPDTPVITLGRTPIRVPLYHHLNLCHFDQFRTINDAPDYDLQSELQHALRHLEIAPAIQTIADSYDIANRIGVHCRRTDFWSIDPETAARHHLDADRKLLSHLQTNYPRAEIFLASDSPYTTLFFKDALGQRLLYHRKTAYPNWSTRSAICMQESLVDFLLLSRCQHLISDSPSTFSRTAAYYGNRYRSIT